MTHTVQNFYLHSKHLYLAEFILGGEPQLPHYSTAELHHVRV
jgi:hypothetical protein